MIVDIVSLPRRLAEVRRKHEEIDSQLVCSFPMPQLHRAYGIWQPNDDNYFGFGCVHPVITGKDAVFRYKFIEPTKYGIAEYFVVASSPIDIGRPMYTKNVKLVCPWVTIVNPHTMRSRKFILWNGITALTRYEIEDTINDIPLNAVMLNELRNLAILHDRPDLLESLQKYPKNYKDIIISEVTPNGDTDLEQLTTLGANIRAYNEMVSYEDPCYWCDIGDVVKGVDLECMDVNMNILSGCSFLNHVLYGQTTIKDIRHLFGMSYDVHAFQRDFNLSPLNKLVELSIYSSNGQSDMFGVLKYLECIPYAELFLAVTNDATIELQIRNQYDPRLKIPTPTDTKFTDLINNLIRELKISFPRFTKINLVKSWGEEVFISVTTTKGTKSHYFDLVSSSLGSRNLIRDYSGSLFV